MGFFNRLSTALDRSHRDRRARGSKRSSRLEKLAHTLFCKPVGVFGFVGRLGLLAFVAVFCYLFGSGFALLIQKAPEPMAVILGVLLISWILGEPGTDRL